MIKPVIFKISRVGEKYELTITFKGVVFRKSYTTELDALDDQKRILDKLRQHKAYRAEFGFNSEVFRN